MNIDKLKSISVTELSTPVKMMRPSELVSNAIGIMRESNDYQVMVEDGVRTGIVSIRDILDCQNITTTKLATLMKHVPRLTGSNSIGDAATIMFDYRIRSLPIFENGKLTGQITSKSIISRMIEVDADLRSSKIMTPHPIFLNKLDNASKAKRIMVSRKIDQLPILDSVGKLDNVVTSSSLVFKLLPPVDKLRMYADWRNRRFSVPAERFATDYSVVSRVTDSIKIVLGNMSKHETTYSMLLGFDDEIQGIVTYGDYMKLLVYRKDGGIVPMYMVGLPEDPFEAETARDKFTRVVKILQKKFPDMLEARAIIKSGISNAPRRKYNVRIFISTPVQRYSYTSFGYELPDVFDQIVPWSKSILKKRVSRRQRVRADAGYSWR